MNDQGSLAYAAGGFALGLYLSILIARSLRRGQIRDFDTKRGENVDLSSRPIAFWTWIVAGSVLALFLFMTALGILGGFVGFWPRII